MSDESNIQTILKKGKLQNAKDLLKQFIAEDPLLTTYITLAISIFYSTLATLLIQALYENNRRVAYFYLEILAWVTLILIIPFLLIRTFHLNRNLKTKAEIKGINDFIHIRKWQEQEKYKQINKLSKARIDNIQAQTQFIMSFSSDSFRQTMRQNAQTLQQDFTAENIQETMHNIFGTLEKVITRFNGIDQQYDQAIFQINEICQKLDIKIEDLQVEPLINPKKATEDLEEKFNQILSEIPPPAQPFDIEEPIPEEPNDLTEELTLEDHSISLEEAKSGNSHDGPSLWECRCGRKYKTTILRCRKCGSSKPT